MHSGVLPAPLRLELLCDRHLPAGQREIEHRSFIQSALSPSFASVPRDDPTDVRQTDARALELLIPMQSMKDSKKLTGILHVETHPVVPHEDHDIIRFVAAAD